MNVLQQVNRLHFWQNVIGSAEFTLNIKNCRTFNDLQIKMAECKGSASLKMKNLYGCEKQHRFCKLCFKICTLRDSAYLKMQNSAQFAEPLTVPKKRS